ncbi:hypothetical protein CSKR_203705 [Clonorchis sinensis]|uniref:Uncharacterized protein n=1 Tax=Clonorchis sinensis TaxID=79923 RepID=A0A8T1N198_CLOSI|nr:hypothetical protein CSKR_203705 [Clonorchis sinensis]
MPRLAIWIGLYLACIENSAFSTSGYSAEEGYDDLDEEPSGGYRTKECTEARNVSNPSAQSHLWIETIVVVDPSVRNRFDTIQQAQLYVQTLMQMTNDLLHHTSLGTNLSISVREILWISEREKFDCLGVVNGNATRDRCGACQGDGSSCKTIRHTLIRNCLFDTSRMKFLFRGDFQMSKENTTTTTRRVLFGTEFTFRTFHTLDGAYFSSVVATGPILGDMAVRIRQVVNDPEKTKLMLYIKYTVVNNNN